MLAQDQAKRLDREKISAACIAQNVAPTAGFFGPLTTTCRNGRAAAGAHHNSVAMPQSGGEPRFAVAASYDPGMRPDFRAEP